MNPETILHAVDLAPVLEVLAAFVAAALTAFLGLASQWIKRKAGIELDLKSNQMVNEAIERGLDFAIARIGPRARFETKNELIALAAGYVSTGVPKALAHFGITPDRLATMIESRLRYNIQPMPVPADPPGVPVAAASIPGLSG